jgi:hypothetical protein
MIPAKALLTFHCQKPLSETEKLMGLGTKNRQNSLWSLRAPVRTAMSLVGVSSPTSKTLGEEMLKRLEVHFENWLNP